MNKTFDAIFKNANIRHYPVAPFYSTFACFGVDYATNIANGERIDYVNDVWTNDHMRISRNGESVCKIYTVGRKLFVSFGATATAFDRRVVASMLPSNFASIVFKNIDADNLLMTEKRLSAKNLYDAQISALFAAKNR